MSKEREAIKRKRCTENSLCHLCEAKVIDGSYYCYRCSMKMSVYHAVNYKKLREEGRCVVCKKVMNEEDKVPVRGNRVPSMCIRCRYEKQIRRKAKENQE